MGRSLLGVLQVVWTPHERVTGTPLDVEHADDVEVEVRESLRLTLLDLKRYRRTLSSVVLDFGN